VTAKIGSWTGPVKTHGSSGAHAGDYRDRVSIAMVRLNWSLPHLLERIDEEIDECPRLRRDECVALYQALSHSCAKAFSMERQSHYLKLIPKGTT
jgi:hypothetical protein